MVQPQLDPWLSGATYTLAVGSLATWLALLVRRSEMPFIRYEPREPVPWGAAAMLLAVFFAGVPLVSTLLGATATLPPQSLDHPTRQIAGYILQQALITGVFVAVIAAFSGAVASDLGLPTSARQLVWGVTIGLVAWLAALLPVQGLQALLFSWFHAPSQHPLVQLVIESPSPVLMVVAFVAAVVVAPICEEIIFRLLLQGWLEKWEDQQLGWRTAQSTAEARCLGYVDGPSGADDIARLSWPGESPAAGGSAETVPAAAAPPRRGLVGLPYGWVPIIISSEMFALAHFGHGTDPIPLVLLGIILGYVYQRTHQITACIVAHTAFNLLSMLVLWRAIQTQAI
jgi:membrane protease YdiL (CAAX protease family)